MKFWLILTLAFMPMAAAGQTIPTEPVKPSPWWTVEQFSLGLIETWTVEADQQLIRFQINNQVWLAADYLTRYAIMQKLGILARQNKFNIRLENNRQVQLAEYKYQQRGWQIAPPLLGATPFSANNGIFFGLR